MVMLLPIWISIGDHGFNGRSDARYAVVSMDMAKSGDWIVPHYMGRIHLTKPPLVYWLESASMVLLGHTYFAVRLPSAIAGTLSLLLLYFFAKKVTTTRVALFSAGMYAVMPLTILPARMTVTDSVVNLLWMGIIFSGYLMTTHRDQRRWGMFFVISAGLGMLAKGPVLFIPVGLVGVWWLISGYGASRLRTLARILVYLVLAMIPALIWAYLVYLKEPEAVNVWIHETFDRAVGSGDHSKPIWFFIPVFFAGCFPASAMLLLPGINLRWKDAIANLRSGNLVGYLGWSIVVPFVVFSLISGKLVSYILPICGPLAILSALILERWFTESKPEMSNGKRMPEVRRGLFVGTILFAVGIGSAIGYTYGLKEIVWVVGLVLAAVAAGFLAFNWKQQEYRVFGMAVFLGAWILGWGALEEIEDIALKQLSYVDIAKQTFGEHGWQGKAGVFQLEDGMIYWDRGGDLERFSTAEDLESRLNEVGNEPILIFTKSDRWDALSETNPQLLSMGKIAAHWNQYPGSPTRYLVVFNSTTHE